MGTGTADEERQLPNRIAPEQVDPEENFECRSNCDRWWQDYRGGNTPITGTYGKSGYATH